MLKAILAVAAVLSLAALAGAAAYFRARVPPGCSDPRTIAAVRQSLTQRFRLPAGTSLMAIRTEAGGWLALRFVCVAGLTGFDPKDLPSGMPVPGEVHYTSRLTADRSRHEVTVTLQPLLVWEKAE